MMKAFLILFVSILLFAKTNAQTGMIEGVITDAKKGDSLSFVPVQLFLNDTLFLMETISNEHGFYQFQNLPSGTFSVSVEQKKYNKRKLQGVQVKEDCITLVDFRLHRPQKNKRTFYNGCRMADPPKIEDSKKQKSKK